jgi:hypothetical protein
MHCLSVSLRIIFRIVKGTQAWKFCWLRFEILYLLWLLIKNMPLFWGKVWTTGRTTSPPPSSSPPQRLHHPHKWRHQRMAAPYGGRPTRQPSASASPSHLYQCQQQLTPCFLACLPGFLHAQSKHLQVSTRNTTWKRDYTLFAASLDQEAGGRLCGLTPQDPAYTPRRMTSTADDDWPLHSLLMYKCL